jgi:hypothetical protein
MRAKQQQAQRVDLGWNEVPHDIGWPLRLYGQVVQAEHEEWGGHSLAGCLGGYLAGRTCVEGGKIHAGGAECRVDGPDAHHLGLGRKLDGAPAALRRRLVSHQSLENDENPTRDRRRWCVRAIVSMDERQRCE